MVDFWGIGSIDFLLNPDIDVQDQTTMTSNISNFWSDGWQFGFIEDWNMAAF